MSEYFTRWLAARKSEVAPASHQRYADAITRFLEFLGGSANRSIEEITHARITAFRDDVLARSSPASANYALKVLRRVFRSARMDGSVLVDPAEGVPSVRNRDDRTRRAFTLDELHRILEVADDEWRSLIRFALYTGQRLGDIVNLTWSQVDLDRDEIRLVIRKTGKSILIPICSALREHILSLPAADNPRAPVHPRSSSIVESNDGRVSPLSQQFAAILKAAGLRSFPTLKSSQKKTPGGNNNSARRTAQELSFHSLRHTAVSLMKDAGIQTPRSWRSSVMSRSQ